MISPSRPVLLVLDGHGSYISIEVIEHATCKFICSVYILQPLDIGVFKSLKASSPKLADSTWPKFQVV